MFKLSQTVAGTWVITTPNPEERGWATQIAEFDTTTATPGSPAHEAIVTSAATSLAIIVDAVAGNHIDDDHTMRISDLFEVTSHDRDEVARMEKRVEKALSSLRGAA